LLSSEYTPLIDELQLRSARRKSLDADTNEVAILAIVRYPLRNQRLVREPRFPRVDAHGLPPRTLGAEADPVEMAGRARHVAEAEDHGLAVGEPPLCHLVDQVWDPRVLV